MIKQYRQTVNSSTRFRNNTDYRGFNATKLPRRALGKTQRVRLTAYLALEVSRFGGLPVSRGAHAARQIALHVRPLPRNGATPSVSHCKKTGVPKAHQQRHLFLVRQSFSPIDVVKLNTRHQPRSNKLLHHCLQTLISTRNAKRHSGNFVRRGSVTCLADGGSVRARAKRARTASTNRHLLEPGKFRQQRGRGNINQACGFTVYCPRIRTTTRCTVTTNTYHKYVRISSLSRVQGAEATLARHAELRR